MIGNQSSDIYTQQVGEAKIFQLNTTFEIDRTNKLIIIII